MDVKTNLPENKYPCLVIWTGGADYVESEEKIRKMDPDNVRVMSKIGGKIYVSPVTGGSEGYFTKNEKEWQRLPKGFSITLTQ